MGDWIWARLYELGGALLALAGGYALLDCVIVIYRVAAG